MGKGVGIERTSINRYVCKFFQANTTYIFAIDIRTSRNEEDALERSDNWHRRRLRRKNRHQVILERKPVNRRRRPRAKRPEPDIPPSMPAAAAAGERAGDTKRQGTLGFHMLTYNRRSKRISTFNERVSGNFLYYHHHYLSI